MKRGRCGLGDLLNRGLQLTPQARSSVTLSPKAHERLQFFFWIVNVPRGNMKSPQACLTNLIQCQGKPQGGGTLWPLLGWLGEGGSPGPASQMFNPESTTAHAWLGHNHTSGEDVEPSSICMQPHMTSGRASGTRYYMTPA